MLGLAGVPPARGARAEGLRTLADELDIDRTALAARLRARLDGGAPSQADVDGLVQCQVNPEQELSFAKLLRSFLRQDPDVILVGEIRDLETAEIAIQAALTGHLVFSTLHTNDAPATVTRLKDMGIQPFMICATVEAILAQRLVRRICTKCREETKVSAAMLTDLGLKAEDIAGKKFFKGTGCENCNNTGYKGRIALFELMILNDKIRDMVLGNASTDELREEARSNGMLPLREFGIAVAVDGHVGRTRRRTRHLGCRAIPITVPVVVPGRGYSGLAIAVVVVGCEAVLVDRGVHRRTRVVTVVVVQFVVDTAGDAVLARVRWISEAVSVTIREERGAVVRVAVVRVAVAVVVVAVAADRAIEREVHIGVERRPQNGLQRRVLFCVGLSRFREESCYRTEHHCRAPRNYHRAHAGALFAE